VRFSVYSELQSWPNKEPQQLYAEVLEQIVNADRLGYYAYAAIEHFFFPKFGASPDPLVLFAAAGSRTRDITFRTLVHVLPYHNPTVLASRIAFFDNLYPGRYEFGVGRGHAWIPPKAGVPMSESRDLTHESHQILFEALHNERFSHDGRWYRIEDSHVVPRPRSERFRVFLGGTNDSTYRFAGERACREHGHEPDIVWIHAVYLDEDRETAKREAESMMRGFLKGNASVLLENADEMKSPEELAEAGYGFYSSGIMEELSDMPYDDMIEKDVVWVGTPADIVERIEAVRELCDGLTEISITVNPGGVEHWKAIKAQELFAAHVMPHFRSAPDKEAEPVLA
jgi:alkanesulfonate monooxygenase SsuD/methylene tetrahydromethanopterin reductase-like flavin-dependent oxidoreductase (luciferase family)